MTPCLGVGRSGVCRPIRAGLEARPGRASRWAARSPASTARRRWEAHGRPADGGPPAVLVIATWGGMSARLGRCRHASYSGWAGAWLAGMTARYGARLCDDVIWRVRTEAGHGRRPDARVRALSGADLASTRGPAKRSASNRRRARSSGQVRAGFIHTLCVSLLNNDAAPPFHVKHYLSAAAHPLVYPQGAQAFYVAFHVKQASLWITSVDNFLRAAPPAGRNLPPSPRLV